MLVADCILRIGLHIHHCSCSVDHHIPEVADRSRPVHIAGTLRIVAADYSIDRIVVDCTRRTAGMAALVEKIGLLAGMCLPEA